MLKLEAGRLAVLAGKLAAAYGLPSPRPAPVLDELVRGILSQATRDANRDRAYAALRASFPSWEAVRDAGAREVAVVIRPAGLANQKARRLVETLERLTRPDGTVGLELGPGTDVGEAWGRLASLPGVGPKTAACVMLFALGLPVVPVDTHVLRVARRLGLAGQRESGARLQAKLGVIVPPELCLPLHLNLLRHGRLVCRARRPRCEACCLAADCPTSRRS